MLSFEVPILCRKCIVSSGVLGWAWGLESDNWSVISEEERSCFHWREEEALIGLHQSSCSMISGSLWLTPWSEGTLCRLASAQILLGRKMSKAVANGDAREGCRYCLCSCLSGDNTFLNSYSNYSTHTHKHTQPLPVCLMQTGLSKWWINFLVSFPSRFHRRASVKPDLLLSSC